MSSRPGITKIMCAFAHSGHRTGQGSNAQSVVCHSPHSHQMYFKLSPLPTPLPITETPSGTTFASPFPSPSSSSAISSTASEYPRPGNIGSNNIRRDSSSSSRLRSSSCDSLSSLASPYLAVPVDRFWTADQFVLTSHKPAAYQDLLVEISLKVAGDGMHYEEEIVDRNLTSRVLKATLCYPDSLKPKNGYIDVL